MPPFCPQCGVDNLPSARFCDQCGATLIPVPAQSVAPAQPAPPVITPVAPVATPQPAAAAQPGSVSAGPSVCPQCGMAVIPGEAFCDSCGAPLMAPLTQSTPAPALRDASSVPQQPSYPPPQPVAPQPSYTPPQPAIPPFSAPPAAAPARTSLALAQLIVQATGAALPLPAQQEALLGRSDVVSSFYPDIDLTNHGALDGGVGRRHLRVFVQGGQLMAEDLDSVNGSALNGQKLMPRQPHQLKDGDVLTLGRVALQVQS